MLNGHRYFRDCFQSQGKLAAFETTGRDGGYGGALFNPSATSGYVLCQPMS